MIILNKLRVNFSDLKYYVSNLTSYISGSNSLSVWYFTQTKNVGDLVGPYLISKMTNRSIKKSILGVRSHYLSVGSIFDQATSKSIIWGSGFISSDQVENTKLKNKILLVRGYLTKAKLEKSSEVKVGDPALALPLFYIPKHGKQYKIGFIPHYADYEMTKQLLKGSRIKIIDVRQGVESFIDDVFSCEFIFSTSLHGLIISDAYSIPNKWVAISDNLSGDGFKFFDYYSIYPNRNVEVLKLNREDIKNLEFFTEKCTYEKSQHIVDDIIKSFQLYD